MAIKAKQNGEVRKPVPAGNYLAVIVGIYDVGTQDGSQYGPKRQVIIQFELHGKKGPRLNEEGKPLLMSNFYNLAFGEKAGLRKDVEAILNRSFTEEEAREGYDVTQLIDVSCRLTVQHQKRKNGEGVVDFISSVTCLDEDDPTPEPQTSTCVYELEMGDRWPEGMPEWVQRKVQKCHEWADLPKSGGRPAARAGNGKQAAGRTIGGDDDTPF